MISLCFMALIGACGYKILNDSERKAEINPNRRELIAMFVQDENGEYSPNTSKEFPKDGYLLNLEKSTCKNGGVLSQAPDTKKISLRVSNADQCTLYFDKEAPNITTAEDALKLLNIEINSSKTPDFTVSATTDETANGLFSMEDDYGTSYYYRGAVENNYVKFGKNTDGADMYWRIIRFNGDGSMRLIYDGTSAHANGESSTDRLTETDIIWNSSSTNKTSIGWTLASIPTPKPTSPAGPPTTTPKPTVSPASSSKATSTPTPTPTAKTAKVTLDTWYKNNILNTEYEKHISDNIFCNDRVEIEKRENLTFNNITNTITNYYYGSSTFNFKCEQKADAYTTKDTTKGNGALTYPIGLITRNEMKAIGKGNTTNNSYFLYKGTSYWTFSPDTFRHHITGSSSTGQNVIQSVFITTAPNNGSLGASSSSGLVPVINIKAESLNRMKGQGTKANPWTLN